MATKLERLLDSIHPSKTIDVVEKRINKALADYCRERNVVSNWEEYHECLAEFVMQARNAALKLPPDAGNDVELNFSAALGYLKEDYPKDTNQIVYEIMRTGAEGGVYQILRTLTGRMAEDFSQNEITARVIKYWNSLSTDELLAAPYEYIEKYKDILPRQIVEGDNVRFRALFCKVLEQHPRMLKQVSELGRSYPYKFLKSTC